MAIVPTGNIKNTFLYGDLQEEVYMKQPPGYVAQEETKVCRLRKAIYGLKKSPRAWFEKNPVLSFLVLAFTNVIQIILTSFGAQDLAL